MSTSWSSGSSRRWRSTRRAVLLANAHENAGRCVLDVGTLCAKHGRACPNVCTGTADQVHHTRGKAYGDDRRYLVACCKACNLHIGQPITNPDPRPSTRW